MAELHSTLSEIILQDTGVLRSKSFWGAPVLSELNLVTRDAFLTRGGIFFCRTPIEITDFACL